MIPDQPVWNMACKMYFSDTYNNRSIVPFTLRRRWEFVETGSAAAILKAFCPDEWKDIVHVLDTFQLDPKTWMRAGGNRGKVPAIIDQLFSERGWVETRIDVHHQGYLYGANKRLVQTLDPLVMEGYLVDNFKGRVVVDVEWNAKDGNLDRDLAAYRAWHEAGIISAAVLITQDRISLRDLARRLWQDYQETLPADARTAKLPIDVGTSTTTNLEKAQMRLRRGVMGTCPVLVVAVTEATWNGAPFEG